MPRDEFGELRAFLEVARERSFTRAATKLGVTRSALSHTVRTLEQRVGVRLLSRTTRDVAPTAAGTRLFEGIEPHFSSIAEQVAQLSVFRTRPAGSVRVVCPDDAVEIVFRRRLPAFLRDHPDVSIELVVDNSLTNIVERQFDAGVRLGEAIERDMVAVRVSPDIKYTVVGSPDYFQRNGAPTVPQALTNHQCINLRLPTSQALYAWEFRKNKRDFNVRVDGQLTFNNIVPALDAVRDGLGLLYVPRELVQTDIDGGRLSETLADWCPVFMGYHLYYPSRRHPSSAFTAFVDAFRYPTTA